MNRWQRRTVYYLTVLTALMFGYTFAYQWGMVILPAITSWNISTPRGVENLHVIIAGSINLEGATGVSATFLHSLQVVVETFTTTGFGSDAPWTSPYMNILVILMDTTGTLMIFLALPVFLFPALENAFSTTVPDAVEDDLSDHVVVATYSPRAQSLIEELETRDVEYVLVEPDGDRAVELYEDGYTVIETDPEAIDGLRSVNLAAARALVVDVSDRIDTSIVLAAREISEAVRVVSVVEDPESRSYHTLAGADEVLTPRRLLGERLARVASTGVVTNLGEAVALGDDFEIAELLVHQGSPLAGVPLAESNLREQTGINVIGAWFQDEFESPVSPDTVLDQEAKPGVDVVGEAYDPDALQAAGIDTARSAILAIPDDTDAEYATLVMRDLTRNLDITARTEGAGSVQKMYRAGANYVQSLATVTGRMTASAVLENDEISTVDSRLALLNTAAPELAGQTLAEAQIREKTNCTVVAVERNNTVLTDVGPDFRIERGDELVVAGPNDAVSRFSETISD
jgi:Trk K+ transport system NAD-binding subunit